MAKEHELLSLSFSWPHTYKLIVSLVLRDQEMVIALNRCAQKAKIQRHFITMREKTNKKNRQSCKHFFFCTFRDRFPYFKAEDERWKNSVRHNLSMNPHFRKGNKAKHGSGHLWVLADIEEADQQVVTATSSVPQIPKVQIYSLVFCQDIFPQICFFVQIFCVKIFFRFFFYFYFFWSFFHYESQCVVFCR